MEFLYNIPRIMAVTVEWHSFVDGPEDNEFHIIFISVL